VKDDEFKLTSRALQLALSLGQDPDLIAQIERGEVHPAMAAFGLRRDQEDLATLSDEIKANRQAQGSRTGTML